MTPKLEKVIPTNVLPGEYSPKEVPRFTKGNRFVYKQFYTDKTIDVTIKISFSSHLPIGILTEV